MTAALPLSEKYLYFCSRVVAWPVSEQFCSLLDLLSHTFGYFLPTVDSKLTGSPAPGGAAEGVVSCCICPAWVLGAGSLL